MAATEPLDETGAPEAEAEPTAGDEVAESEPQLAAVPESPAASTANERVFAKSSLVALAHGIEASLLADEPDPGDLPVVLALFQQETYFDAERRRYREIARNSLVTLVGFVDTDPDVPSPIRGVALHPGEALASTFALFVVSK